MRLRPGSSSETVDIALLLFPWVQQGSEQAEGQVLCLRSEEPRSHHARARAGHPAGATDEGQEGQPVVKEGTRQTGAWGRWGKGPVRGSCCDSEKTLHTVSSPVHPVPLAGGRFRKWHAKSPGVAH